MSISVKKVIALVLVTLLVGSVLFACGQTGSSTSTTAAAATQAAATTAAATTAPATTAAPQPVKLSVAMMCPDFTDAANQIMDGFSKKYPNISVDFAQIPQTTCSEYLQPKAAANSLPDFTSIEGGAFGSQLADNGMLVDLTGTVAANNEVDGLKTVFTSKSGKLFGIAGGLSTVVVYYNKQLFQQAGITNMPANWDEFLSTCDTLKKKNITPLAVACADGTIGNTFWSFGFANDVISKDNNAVKELTAGTLNMNTPEYANIFARLKTLFDKGYLIKGVTSLQYMQANDAFLQGKTAMLFAGIWLNGTMMKSTFGTGVMLPPFNAAGQTVVPVLATETGFAVAEGPNKDAALKLLDYITQDEGYYIYQNARGNIPFQKSYDASKVKLDPAVADYIKNLQTYTLSGPLYFEVLPTDMTNTISQYFQRVITGELTPQKAAEAQDQALKAAFAK